MPRNKIIFFSEVENFQKIHIWASNFEVWFIDRFSLNCLKFAILLELNLNFAQSFPDYVENLKIVLFDRDFIHKSYLLVDIDITVGTEQFIIQFNRDFFCWTLQIYVFFLWATNLLGFVKMP